MMKKQESPVYLDCNATMPIKPGVIDVMTSALHETGNASSIHGFGRAARRHIETAREAVAEMVGTSPAYVFFTSGATESNNTILNTFHGQKIFVSAIEHPSVLESVPDAERIPVTQDGVIDLDALELMLIQKPDLVSVMLVNNETGVIQPVAEIVRMARKISPATRIHTDAAQAAGRIVIDFSALQVDYLTLSAHKMGGPQGCGALIMAPGARIEKLLRGGGQEKRQRPGTENVAAIAGFGEAARLAVRDMEAFQSLANLRDSLEEQLKSVEPRLVFFGVQSPRVANTSQIGLPGIAAETLLMSLDLSGIAVSSGSACSSGTVKSPHAIEAMGIDPARPMGVLRVSMGWPTTKEDIDRFMAAWLEIHARIKDKVA